MKKIFFVLFLVFVLFSSTVYAAGNGTYKGYAIVNVKVNGKLVQADVPAINFNGRTLVPVRIVSENLGADVQWDEKTETAIITSKGNASVEAEKQKLKDLVKIMDYYKYVEEIGDVLFVVGPKMYIGMDSVYLNDSTKGLDSAREYLNESIAYYNDNLEWNKEIKPIAAKYNINLSEFDQAMDSYKQSIDLFKKAFDHAYKFYKDNTDANHENYMSNLQSGTNMALQGKDIAKEGYENIYSMITN